MHSLSNAQSCTPEVSLEIDFQENCVVQDAESDKFIRCTTALHAARISENAMTLGRINNPQARALHLWENKSKGRERKKWKNIAKISRGTTGVIYFL